MTAGEVSADGVSDEREGVTFLLAAGFDQYVSKPIVDESVLLEAITRLLDRKRGTSLVAAPARKCVEPARKPEAGLRVDVAS